MTIWEFLFGKQPEPRGRAGKQQKPASDFEGLRQIVAGSKLGEALLGWASRREFDTITRAASRVADRKGEAPSLEGLLHPRGADDHLRAYRLSRKLLEHDPARPEYWHMQAFALDPVDFPKGPEGFAPGEAVADAQLNALRKAVQLRPDYFEALLDLAYCASQYGVGQGTAHLFQESLYAFNSALRLCQSRDTRGVKKGGIIRLRQDCLFQRWRSMILDLTEAPDGTVVARLNT
jgi:hypothetical protein